MKVTLIVPTLNEIDGMREIMPKIQRNWVDEIIIIDGGSTDGTYEYAIQHPKYITIKQKKKGLVNAYKEALQVAKGEYIVFFSPDGNSLPELIPSLIKRIKDGYDMVIVSRYLEGAKSDDDDMLTGFGNWMFTKLINIFFHAKYTDSLVIFRAFKKDIIPLCVLDPYRAGLEPQLSIVCAKHKKQVTEIPGDEPKRIGGKRKMDPLKNGLGIIYLIFRELLYR